MTGIAQSDSSRVATHVTTAAEHPEISYGDALNQGLRQAMELSDSVIVLGQLVDYGPGVFGSTTGLVERFGPERVRDFPVSESAMTATGIGAAVAGCRPVLVHHRLDFMLYSMDAIVNWMALWRFKSNTQSSLPIVIRAIVGRGWGQGPQHSKSLHAWFAHVPGIKVAMPATAVPTMPYRVRFGRAAVRRVGGSLTIVAVGVMVPFALRVADRLAAIGVDSEVVDLRTVAPLDSETVCASVEKTGRLCVMDPAWQSFGVSAEIVARVAERSGRALRSEPVRICHPDSHTPMSSALEVLYYPEEQAVVDRLRSIVVDG